MLLIIDLLKCKPKDYRYYLPAHYKLGCLGNINIRQLGNYDVNKAGITVRFVSHRPFQPSLMSVGKAGAYPSGVPSRCSHIRLGH